MNKIYNYLILSALVLATVCCTNKELDFNIPSGTNGNEVKFGFSFDEPKTKTIYGPEDVKKDDNGNVTEASFPVYWTQGDKVLVASPQCSFKSAEYQVTPVSGQSYAEALNKTGDAGVQWGSTNADFYSVYPSTNASWSSLAADEVVAKLNIASQQEANIVLDGKTYSAADMDNVIMYAQTNNVTNGETVDLRYKPYSTMLEFEMQIAQNTDQQGNPAGYGSVKVLSLTLTAPTGISITGDFSLKFNGDAVPTIKAVGNNGGNSIKMVFTTQPMLNEENKSLKAKLAMIPLSGIDNLTGWKVDVEVLKGTDSTPTTYTQDLSAIKSPLVPGRIHKIQLPKFKSTSAWKPDMSNWIPTLQDYANIYLTELSIPGAWYAGAKVSDGYQSTQSIGDLWDKGVRAFAIETKCVSSTFKLVITYPLATPSNVVVSGTADNASIETEAGTNSLGTGSGKKIYKEDSGNITLKTIFENIIDCLKAQENTAGKKPEFAVLVLSYADGGTSGMRPVDFGAWLELLYDSYNSLNSDYKKYIYSEGIGKDTTVGEVLNKLIIKVNVDSNIAMSGHVKYDLRVYNDERSYTYGNNLPALFSYNPFMSQLNSSYYNTPLFSSMHWMTWGDDASYRNYVTELGSDFLWCFASANRTQVDGGTGNIPTYEQRKSILRSMMEHSKELTASQNHNVWFYFNAGGTQTTSQSDESTSAQNFANAMNPWLLNLIRLKANGGTDTDGIYGTKGAYVESDPSPLGIVMFNQCTSDTGKQIVEEIVYMNNKFKLLRNDPNVPRSSYGSSATTGGSAF